TDGTPRCWRRGPASRGLVLRLDVLAGGLVEVEALGLGGAGEQLLDRPRLALDVSQLAVEVVRRLQQLDGLAPLFEPLGRLALGLGLRVERGLGVGDDGGEEVARDRA